MIAFPNWLRGPEFRLVLQDEDFETLVRGGEVRRDGVRITLADIGWHRMLEHIGHAMRGSKEDHGLSK